VKTKLLCKIFRQQRSGYTHRGQLRHAEDNDLGLEANTAGDYPEIAPSAYVHSTATGIGRVYVGACAFIGPHAVIRADEAGQDGNIESIVIGESANVQDCAIIHALGGTGVTIDQRTSIAHAAVIHGPCKIGVGCFVGFNSVVFRATLGDGVIVMHQSLVEEIVVPQNLLVPSMTAVRCEEDLRQLTRVTEDIVTFVERVCKANVLLAQSASRKSNNN
jgi:carbonic anhydrase/acetyltransferase-like protein (isoleucine patch superfamily)